MENNNNNFGNLLNRTTLSYQDSEMSFHLSEQNKLVSGDHYSSFVYSFDEASEKSPQVDRGQPSFPNPIESFNEGRIRDSSLKPSSAEGHAKFGTALSKKEHTGSRESGLERDPSSTSEGRESGLERDPSSLTFESRS